MHSGHMNGGGCWRWHAGISTPRIEALSATTARAEGIEGVGMEESGEVEGEEEEDDEDEGMFRGLADKHAR